jgi:hypothetical protein
MHRTRRLAIGLTTAALALGGTVLAAAPASAATTHQLIVDGFATEAECQASEASWFQIIEDRGGQIFAGESCLYAGADRQWLFSVMWEED